MKIYHKIAAIQNEDFIINRFFFILLMKTDFLYIYTYVYVYVRHTLVEKSKWKICDPTYIDLRGQYLPGC